MELAGFSSVISLGRRLGPLFMAVNSASMEKRAVPGVLGKDVTSDVLRQESDQALSEPEGAEHASFGCASYGSASFWFAGNPQNNSPGAPWCDDRPRSWHQPAASSKSGPTCDDRSVCPPLGLMNLAPSFLGYPGKPGRSGGPLRWSRSGSCSAVERVQEGAGGSRD